MRSKQEIERQVEAGMSQLDAAFRAGELSLAQIAFTPKEDLEAVYATGLRLIAMDKFEDAASVLSALTIYEPYDARFWRALGLALQKGKRLGLALIVYDISLKIAEQDITTLAYRGEALILANRRDEAKRDLERVVQHGRTDDAAFVTRAKGLLRYLSVRA